MTSMNSAVHFPVDGASQVRFRQDGAGAITASDASDAISLDELVATWNSGNIPQGQLALSIFVNSADTANANESYVFEVQSDNSAAFGAPVTHMTTASFTAPGLYVVALDIKTVRKVDPDCSHLRLNAVLAGTTPSLDYEAWALKLA
ncbi:MAG: hypothetical protein AAF495_25390 [Pseudomonadota bacterium]